VKKLEKELAAGADVSEQLEDAKVELNYTLYFPDGVKYISLFKDPGDAGGVREKRDEIKRDIKRKMEKGTLGRRTTSDEEGGEGMDAAVTEEDMVEEEEEQEEKTKLEKAKTRHLKPEIPGKEKVHAEKPKDRKKKEKKEKEKKSGSKKDKQKTELEPAKDRIENDDFFEF